MGLLDDDVPLGRAGLDDLWADDDEDEGPSAEQQRKALLKPPGGIADKVSEMKQREQKRREAAENEEQEKLKAQEERNKDIDLVNAAPRKLSRAQRFGRRLARKKRAFFGRSTAGYDDCFESLAAVGLEEHDMQTLRLAYRAIDEEHEGEQAPTLFDLLAWLHLEYWAANPAAADAADVPSRRALKGALRRSARRARAAGSDGRAVRRIFFPSRARPMWNRWRRLTRAPSAR